MYEKHNGMRGSTNDNDVVSIRHRIPASGKDDKDESCRMVGYFCSKKNKFVHWSSSNGKISMGSENHTNIQWWGHKVKCTTSLKQREMIYIGSFSPLDYYSHSKQQLRCKINVLLAIQ